MKLSIIVVNHNLCMWLKQAVGSLVKACNGFDCEVIVVDNASADRSVKMMEADFPGVKLILNSKNDN
ncbi:MAG: glycosyltransferase [Sphingobacteriales bacterium]|nr:MAG: glycosyltransferase [Sphingobacteriales bacterium]